MSSTTSKRFENAKFHADHNIICPEGVYIGNKAFYGLSKEQFDLLAVATMAVNALGDVRVDDLQDQKYINLVKSMLELSVKDVIESVS